VLFLHAFPLGLSMWDAQVEALAPTHTLVRFDDRGFGGSAPADGLLTMERIADDAAALLDYLGLSQAVVCGCSMGGYAAFAMVRKHPLRVKGLVLADTRAEPDGEEARQNRARLAEEVRRRGSEAALDAFLPKLLGETTRKQRRELVERVKRMILAAPPRGICDALFGLAARADSRSTLREIRVPTLVVCGAEDVITPPPVAEEMRAGIAGARLQVIPGAGHLANMEEPQAFNDVLLGFLADR
jgi:pimeloyl-ACP methyl ester carboxylesterase